jgi:glycosyltransferase involved in cell wall biosynthesis
MSQFIGGVPTPVYEDTRLEIVTTCVGFDDLLEFTLSRNIGECDTYIVVTTHADKKTQAVARNYGALCVQTDLFSKNGRSFNKGAAINAGFDYFQYNGWRLHLDADIMLPPSFYRILFNHSRLDRNTIYGADRLNVIGKKNIDKLHRPERQHNYRLLLAPNHGTPAHRLVCSLRGYLPCGYFQMWHASNQKPYPYSLGTAAHDDMMFAASWPENNRRILPGAFVYHVCPSQPKVGENWEGKRKQPRIKP